MKGIPTRGAGVHKIKKTFKGKGFISVIEMCENQKAGLMKVTMTTVLLMKTLGKL